MKENDQARTDAVAEKGNQKSADIVVKKDDSSSLIATYLDKPKHRTPPEGDVVGLSLSFCISGILRGETDINNVKMIISATNVPDGEWDSVLKSYSETYWSEDPQKGIEIAKTLIDGNKIIQPRQMGMEAHNIADGHWVEA